MVVGAEWVVSETSHCSKIGDSTGTTGSSLSVIMTVKSQSMLPQLFVAVILTFVVPALNVEPLPVPLPLPVVAPVNSYV